MIARIFQPAKTAMQSGTAKTRGWTLEFVPDEARQIDPLMGWTSSGDTQTQVRLRFDSKEAAISYAEKNGIIYRLDDPNKRSHIIRPGGYGDNFAHQRRMAWTH
ncbi:ETC complex I subunit [Algicella marina]|uniref:ETC complex I subunit n=1 Tax=Algicella marina TaxID=2683284 RepID=A0A6P1T6M5_9RHOB|nr:ETC complex I subunit [Algicella marina]QHQ37353.1 ETC complex I subunit [Algicella marina]